MHRSRNRIRLLALSGLSVVAMLLALEICVRWFFHAEIDPAALRQRLEGTSVRALVFPSPDPELLFELKPNQRRWFHGRWVRTGADGHRIATSGAETEPSSDAVRLAVLGDSTSFGWGVSYEESYPELYRTRMAELAGVPVELRNYSVPAYNAEQEARLFQTRVSAYRPHLVLLHHDHNDSEPATKMMGDNYMPVEYGDNPLHSALIKWSMRRWRQLRNERARAVDEEGNRYVGGYVVSGPLYDAHLEARRELVAAASELPAPVIAVLFNAFVQRDDAYASNQAYIALHRQLGERLEGMGYAVLDLYPRYQSALRERGWPNLSAWWVGPDDAHPNAAGHAFIADSLVELTLEDERLAAVFGLTPD